MTKYSFDLVKFPNQAFSTTVNDNSVEISFRTYKKILYATISINKSIAESGRRCLPNTDIFGKSVSRILGGNFRFECETDDYPSYENFDGKNCVLVLEVY